MKVFLSLLFSLTLLSNTIETEVVKHGAPFLIVNKAVNQLAFINHSEIQEIFSAGTGKSKELTPEGLFTVKVKAINPYYRKKNIPGGDPRNPLGTRWIGFNANKHRWKNLWYSRNKSTIFCWKIYFKWLCSVKKL